ncbi:hypothetical protein RJ641_032514 [Dillenia turbinata]|uniref:BUB1 N-terminal domain-containing protein n=1 Tax=Dillenia turbinata TaxID=194707 RepID=A0AAN8VZM4_9MAGN
MFKENATPLKIGRSIALLNEDLKSHTDNLLKKSLFEHHRLIEAKDANQGDDPLQPWLECIERETALVLLCCSNNVCDLFGIQIATRMIFALSNFLDSNQIGESHSLNYMAYAKYMESRNIVKIANYIFNLGIARIKNTHNTSVAAKNVILPSVEPTIPRSTGRHQLFHLLHPCHLNGMRRKRGRYTASAMDHSHLYNLAAEKHQFCDTAALQDLEEVAAFCENAQNLSPSYFYISEEVAGEVSLVEDFSGSVTESPEIASRHGVDSEVDIGYLLKHLEVDDEGQMGYQEFHLWRQKASHSKTEDVAKDIFAVCCILAELHLGRPLFNLASLSITWRLVLPPCIKLLVEACITERLEELWIFFFYFSINAFMIFATTGRPSGKSLLESPYFDRAVKSSYLFLAPLHLLAKDGSRLSYVANFAKRGVFKAMGASAAEKCVPIAYH